MYEYKAIVVKVYDGDTVTVDIDLGFHMWMKKQSIRLYGIDTPELRGESRERGLVVRDFVQGLILNKVITLHSFKDKKGKYGRWLAIIYIDGVNLNDLLVSIGYATELKY